LVGRLERKERNKETLILGKAITFFLGTSSAWTINGKIFYLELPLIMWEAISKASNGCAKGVFGKRWV